MTADYWEAWCYSDVITLQALYERLFQFIVSRVNKAVAVELPEGTPTTVISVLDIYGFEVLEANRWSKQTLISWIWSLQQISFTMQNWSEKLFRQIELVVAAPNTKASLVYVVTLCSAMICVSYYILCSWCRFCVVSINSHVALTTEPHML